MAKKLKHGAPPASPAQLRSRAVRALDEGRFHQALELTRPLYKAEPTPANLELLHQAILGRARQLRLQGSEKDARVMLEQAIPASGGEPAWLEKLAAELAASGAVPRALALLERVPGGATRGEVLAKAVDAAVAQGPTGRSLLPAELQEAFDRTLKAFDQVAAGQDDAARESLQTVGLQSPLLEWKVFLRGLQAYYQNDDVRALENWQRLRPERLPARLAAPFRFRIDGPFRQAQAPETQTALQRQADAIQGSFFVPQLRPLQAALAQEDLPKAFRLAENLVPTMRQQVPHLVARLASCFYWTIVHGGQPEDMNRFRRTFGAPADDPNFDRMQALINESGHQLQDAHHFWQDYDAWVAANPKSWSGDQANRVRSLIWHRMGQNAASLPDEKDLKKLPPFLRDHPDRPRPLVPDAEECFRQSLKLAPDQLDGHEALVQYHMQRDDRAKAQKAARQLLKHFPEHLPTLTALGDLCMEQQEYKEALEAYQRAMKVQPLDRRLRSKASTAHSYHARAFAEEGRFDEARAEYRAALGLNDQADASSVLCKWAACEFKAGDEAQAEELLQKAQGQTGTRLAVAFSMLIEVIRLKLPRALKTRFDREFKEGLAEAPTGAAAAAIADTAVSHHLAGIKYHGQKTHEKKVQTYLERSIRADFTEPQIEIVIGALLGLRALKLLRKFTTRGRHLFPKSPFFLLAEAQSYIAQGPGRAAFWRIAPLLEQARHLAEALPHDARQQEFLEAIQKAQDGLGAGNPFLSGPGRDLFESMMDQMFNGPDDFDDDDEDDLF